ncbi:hypothetical protein MSM1_19885 [Mycobacterium sp. SM1]|uniref:hypothetical protein n=1 Tax=Mycobacterium sp. SM1 TaxID=2816243 RepID=UPI001BD17748|nr:hypothetical protein [Mycobacterium sp. SM1]MBS4730487.1 hypothetical protein [Mycobacterium sp. SM1]
MIARPVHGRVTGRLPKSPTVPRSPAGHPQPPALDASTGRVHPADAAQAGLFERILQAEIAELRELAMLTVARWAETSGNRQPKPLTELTTSIEELHRLLTALRNRFPPGSMRSEPA